jgi:hypothetical protein
MIPQSIPDSRLGERPSGNGHSRQAQRPATTIPSDCEGLDVAGRKAGEQAMTAMRPEPSGTPGANARNRYYMGCLPRSKLTHELKFLIYESSFPICNLNSPIPNKELRGVQHSEM